MPFSSTLKRVLDPKRDVRKAHQSQPALDLASRKDPGSSGSSSQHVFAAESRSQAPGREKIRMLAWAAWAVTWQLQLCKYALAKRAPEAQTKQKANAYLIEGSLILQPVCEDSYILFTKTINDYVSGLVSLCACSPPSLSSRFLPGPDMMSGSAGVGGSFLSLLQCFSDSSSALLCPSVQGEQPGTLGFPKQGVSLIVPTC